MAFVRPLLYVALGLLMVVSIIELSFISSMVGWLHGNASGTFSFEYRGTRHTLKGEPANLIVDQGHTSNGAAGTAFVLIGCGGIIALILRNRQNSGKFSRFFYNTWLLFNVLSLLLILTALIHTLVVTNNHNGQRINPGVAAGLDVDEKYPLQSWTPQNWFSAFLKLDLTNSNERNDIEHHLRLMRGWQYNLIPFFIIHLAETGLALWDAMLRPKEPVPAYAPPKHTV
ncbi:40S ribosomal s10 protein [Fusarium napiforme]|uniref:40S ribosomal s10 protein n=1 Tax=Fusarium napiforme TaxID=42672 RepID=A0A8H5K367_9HYPO|nr:40S ribosomal s10 protein [Fusarium napiforme]